MKTPHISAAKAIIAFRHEADAIEARFIVGGMSHVERMKRLSDARDACKVPEARDQERRARGGGDKDEFLTAKKIHCASLFALKWCACGERMTA